MRNSETFFRYVIHERVLDYLRCGWHISCVNIAPHHAQYGVLMTWLCSCKLVEPR